jgi:hypothetical protein
MQANQHLLLQLWILAKRIGSILISGNILSMTFRVSCGDHLDSCQVRHRTSDVRCRVQHRTYDIVRTILHTILYIRHRTFVNNVGATYDIVCQTYDIVGSRKSMSYTMSYVSENLRHRRFEIVYRIRCRRCLSYTMSYVYA